MAPVNSVTTQPACPRCGSTEARLARKEERPRLSLVRVRRLRRCLACGNLFEPSCGTAVGFIIVACGVLMGYVCIQPVLATALDAQSSPSLFRWARGIVGLIGGVYLVAIGLRAMTSSRSLEP